MRWVSYTRSISSRIGEENPANTIAEQNANIEQYLKNKGYRISEKYSDRKFFMWLHYFAPHADYSPPPEFNKFTDPAYRGPIDGSKRSLSDAMLMNAPCVPRSSMYLPNT